MKYKIVVDNACELTDKINKCDYVEVVKSSDEKTINDTNSKYLKVILNNMQYDKKNCPSPEEFNKTYQCDAEVIFVVTMSRKLCGAFGSAVIGRSLYFEEYGEDKIIKVFNSNAVSKGEASIVERIIESIEAGCSYKEICTNVESLKKERNSRFMAETLEYIKNFGAVNMMAEFSVS